MLDAFESIGKSLIALTEPPKVVKAIAAIKGCEDVAARLHKHILLTVPLLREAQARLSEALDNHYTQG